MVLLLTDGTVIRLLCNTTGTQCPLNITTFHNQLEYFVCGFTLHIKLKVYLCVYMSVCFSCNFLKFAQVKISFHTFQFQCKDYSQEQGQGMRGRGGGDSGRGCELKKRGKKRGREMVAREGGRLSMGESGQSAGAT